MSEIPPIEDTVRTLFSIALDRYDFEHMNTIWQRLEERLPGLFDPPKENTPQRRRKIVRSTLTADVLKHWDLEAHENATREFLAQRWPEITAAMPDDHGCSFTFDTALWTSEDWGEAVMRCRTVAFPPDLMRLLADLGIQAEATFYEWRPSDPPTWWMRFRSLFPFARKRDS